MQKGDHKLLTEFHEGTINQAGLKRLLQRLEEDADFRADAAQSFEVHVLLDSVRCEDELADRITRSFQASAGEGTRELLAERIMSGLPTPSRARAWSRWPTALAAAAALVVAAAVGLFVAREGDGPVQPHADVSPWRLGDMRGRVRVQGAAVAVGDLVRRGHTIVVPARGRVVLVHDNGLRLTLSGRSRLRVGPRLLLEHGLLHADVPKQARGAIVFVTPHAEATVVGTRLAIATTTDMTRLDVSEGLVRFERLADEAVVDVAAGQFACAAEGVDLVARASAGRAVSPAYGGVIFQAYAPVYDQGEYVLEALSPADGQLIARLEAKDLAERLVIGRPQEVQPIVSDGALLVNSVGRPVKFGLPLAHLYSLPEDISISYRLRFRLTPGKPTGDADAVLLNSNHGLREFDATTIPGLPAGLAEPDGVVASSLVAGRWLDLRFEAVTVGQLPDGRRLYETRMTSGNGGQRVSHRLRVAGDTALGNLRYQVAAMKIEFGTLEIRALELTADRPRPRGGR